MSEYVRKVNKKNPIWTRCQECGEGWTRRVVKKRCPVCKTRGSMVFFHQYDLIHCPMCAHIIDGANTHSPKFGICKLCGSDIAIVNRSMSGNWSEGMYLDVEKYNRMV